VASAAAVAVASAANVVASAAAVVVVAAAAAAAVTAAAVVVAAVATNQPFAFANYTFKAEPKWLRLFLALARCLQPPCTLALGWIVLGPMRVSVAAAGLEIELHGCVGVAPLAFHFS
jgi:hypothetical protein